MNSRVLVVVAHPDDEVLGCGGTVARHAEEGDRVAVAIVAEGITSRDPDHSPEARSGELGKLKAAAQKASEVMGGEPPQFLGFPDNRLDGIALLDIVKAIEGTVEAHQPDVIYTHHGGDLNVDHRLVHQAVVTAARPLPGKRTRAIYTFETLSSTEWATASIDGQGFRATRFVGISDGQLQRKLDALACYADEVRPFPHPRSPEAVRALAAVRGSSVGCMAAEAFGVVREVV